MHMLPLERVRVNFFSLETKSNENIGSVERNAVRTMIRLTVTLVRRMFLMRKEKKTPDFQNTKWLKLFLNTLTSPWRRSVASRWWTRRSLRARGCPGGGEDGSSTAPGQYKAAGPGRWGDIFFWPCEAARCAAGVSPGVELLLPGLHPQVRGQPGQQDLGHHCRSLCRHVSQMSHCQCQGSQVSVSCFQW